MSGVNGKVIMSGWNLNHASLTPACTNRRLSPSLASSALFCREELFDKLSSDSFGKFLEKDRRKQEHPRKQIAHRPLPFTWDFWPKYYPTTLAKRYAKLGLIR
jgi:hypothetical protein